MIKKCNCGVQKDQNFKEIKQYLASLENSQELAEFFKVFGDPTRIKILFALRQNEICVCDIAKLLDMTPSAISHQLRVLKQAKLVKNRRQGKVIFYSLDDNHIELILKLGLEHVVEQK